MLYLKELQIAHFGSLNNVTIPLERGINLISGANEAGKSTLAAFIRFIFYGFSGKAERESRLSADGTPAAGAVVLETDGKAYRAERRCSGTSDRAQVIDLDTNAPVKLSVSPGQFFFGMPVEVYSNTAYFLQAGGGVVNGRDAGEAIDNMLFGADESAGTAKALKKLDEARIALWHKNKKGGLIFELENRREQLLARRDRAEAASAEIIALNGQLADTGEKLRVSLRKSERLHGQLAAYEQTQRKLQQDRVRMLETQKENTARRLHTAEAELQSDALHTIRTLGAEQEALRRGAEECRTALTACKSAMGTEEEQTRLTKLLNHPDGMHDAMDRLNGLQKKKRHQLLCGGIFGLLFPAAALGGVLLLERENRLPAWGCFAAALLCLILLAVFLIRASGVRTKRKALLHELGIENEAEMEKLICRARETGPEMEKAASLRRKLEAYEAETARKQQEAEQLALHLGFVSASEAEKVLDSREKTAAQCRAELDKQTALLENARAMLPKETEEVSEAELPSVPQDFDAAEAKREYRFLTKAVEALRDRTHTCEVRLAGLNSSAESPAELTEQLRALDSRLSVCRERYEAYLLAYQAIAEAGENFRNSIAPRLSACAGKAMEILTDGKYTSLGVDPSFSVYYDAGGSARTAPASVMSCGTRDAAYLSLRLAILELVCRKSAPPVIFDESFVYYDAQRLRCAMRLLTELSEGTQILILTASDRERSALMPGSFHAVALE